MIFGTEKIKSLVVSRMFHHGVEGGLTVVPFLGPYYRSTPLVSSSP
jgi:hypothetical protein